MLVRVKPQRAGGSLARFGEQTVIGKCVNGSKMTGCRWLALAGRPLSGDGRVGGSETTACY